MEISQKTIFQNKNYHNKNMKQDMSYRCLDLWLNIKGQEETEEKLHQLYKRKKHFKSQFLYQEHSKNVKYQPLSLEDITIEAIFQLE